MQWVRTPGLLSSEDVQADGESAFHQQWRWNLWGCFGRSRISQASGQGNGRGDGGRGIEWPHGFDYPERQVDEFVLPQSRRQQVRGGRIRGERRAQGRWG